MSRSWFISLQQVLHLTFIGGKFDRCIHAWICKFYSCTLYKNCIEKLFKLSEPCSVLDLWREERKARNYVLSSAWAYVWMVSFQETLYTVVCMFGHVYLRRVLSVAEKKSLQLPQYWPERHHKLTVYASKRRIIFTCKSVLFFLVYQSSLDVTG